MFVTESVKLFSSYQGLNRFRESLKGISLLQKFLEIFGNMGFVSRKMKSHLTSHNFQISKIDLSSKPCKIPGDSWE